MDENLVPTYYLDFDNGEASANAKQAKKGKCTISPVRVKAEEVVEGKKGDIARAVALFYFVRDTIPYKIIFDIPGKHYFRASETLRRGDGFCMPKAVLLAALARSVGIPVRLHFADIINHIVPEYISDRLKTKLMTYHNYVEFLLDGKWVKATPSFDLATCRKHGFEPVEFDGKSDAMLHERDQKGRLHIEYVADYGTRSDFPLGEVVAAFNKAYPHIPGLVKMLSGD